MGIDSASFFKRNSVRSRLDRRVRRRPGSFLGIAELDVEERGGRSNRVPVEQRADPTGQPVPGLERGHRRHDQSGGIGTDGSEPERFGGISRRQQRDGWAALFMDVAFDESEVSGSQGPGRVVLEADGDAVRNSERKRPLRIAGFQSLPPKSTGAAVEAPAIERLIGPAPGTIRPCPLANGVPMDTIRLGTRSRAWVRVLGRSGLFGVGVSFNGHVGFAKL